MGLKPCYLLKSFLFYREYALGWAVIVPIKHTMFSFAGWWESLRTSNIKGRIQCNNFYRVFIQHKSMRYRPVKVTQPKETAESSETSFFRILSPIVPGPLSIVSFLSYYAGSRRRPPTECVQKHYDVAFLYFICACLYCFDAVVLLWFIMFFLYWFLRVYIVFISLLL